MLKQITYQKHGRQLRVISAALLISTIFLFESVAHGQTIKDTIRIEIKDSLLFINNDVVPSDSIVKYFQLHFGEPNRKRKGHRYKWHKYIYDDLGIFIMTHPKSISIDFYYRRIIKANPKSTFKGTVIINGHLINPIYSFAEIEKLLYPCRFDNLFNRSLLGTFFSFERGIDQPEKLISIGYHFIANPNDRIKPYLIK